MHQKNALRLFFLLLSAFRRAQQNHKTQEHSPEPKDGITFNIGLIGKKQRKNYADTAKPQS